MMTRIILVFTAAAMAAGAQQWEFGGMAGGSFLNTVGVTAPSGSARAGFANGAAFGAWLGYNSNKHFGGEVRYSYLPSDLKLTSNGTSATFGGESHAVHYDIVFHTTKGESAVQFYGSVGGGMKIFRGTGTEHAAQNLSDFGYLTKTTQVEPMGTVAGGLKFRITPKVFLRTEVRDYITPFPSKVIAAPSGVKYGSILNNLVAMVGIGAEM